MESSAFHQQGTQTAPKQGPWVAALSVALATGFITVASAPVAGFLTPDPTEHLAIAHAWVHGSGFVDPVKWNFYLPDSVPLPAFAVRPPVISVLAALPLAFGATLDALLILHKLWASFIAGAAVLVACRFMRPAAATGAILLIMLSPQWVLLAQAPTTEVTALAAYLAVLATARGVLWSVPGALLCVLATALAGFTRHVLVALAPAVLAAALWELGPKSTVRRTSVWTYGVGCAVLYAAINLAVAAATGHVPYAGYGFMVEMLSYEDILGYQKEYVGAWTFLTAHKDEIFELISFRVEEFFQILCLDSAYHYVGWLIPVAMLYGLWRRRDGVLEHRVNAFSVLGFSLVFLVNYAAASPRHLLIVAMGTSLCGLSMVDEALQRFERRLRSRGRERVSSLLAATPLVGVLLFCVGTTGGKTVPDALRLWVDYRAYGTMETAERSFGELSQDLCPHIHKDAIVADPRPWGAALLCCGNAIVRLPSDLTSRELQDRFMYEQHPGYFLSVDDEPGWLRSSPRLREVARSGEVTLFEVRDAAPASRPWKAPPPLVCAGRGSDCARLFGR